MLAVVEETEELLTHMKPTSDALLQGREPRVATSACTRKVANSRDYGGRTAAPVSVGEHRSRTCVRRTANSVNVPAEATMPTFTGAANVSSAPLKLSVVEAPKLNVLEYDGRPERYPFFRAQVDEAHTSGNYSDVKILQHLRGRLKGVAFDAVSGALLSGATLDDVLSVIRKRLRHPRVVVKSVIDSLLKRPRVQ